MHKSCVTLLSEEGVADLTTVGRFIVGKGTASVKNSDQQRGGAVHLGILHSPRQDAHEMEGMHLEKTDYGTVGSIRAHAAANVFFTVVRGSSVARIDTPPTPRYL